MLARGHTLLMQALVRHTAHAFAAACTERGRLQNAWALVESLVGSVTDHAIELLLRESAAADDACQRVTK